MREAFVTAPPESTPRTFFDFVRDVFGEVTQIPFLLSLAAWVECPNPLGEPVDFGRGGWEAYMDCVYKKTLYFFAGEVISMCLVSNANVAVFEADEGVLKFACGSFAAAGVVACFKLSSNRF